MRLPSVLSIAGSDSSGGAGIQADIKTALSNGVYAMSAVTALTAQNTMGVTGIHEVPPEFLAEEIDAVFADIRPDAVKVGMVASAELIRTIAERLLAHGAAHIVVDPVIVATSGARLLAEDAANALAEKLFPLAEVITPNLPELFVLDQLIDYGIPRGSGDPGIDNFDDQIHHLQVFLYELPGLFHVARIPVYVLNTFTHCFQCFLLFRNCVFPRQDRNTS